MVQANQNTYFNVQSIIDFDSLKDSDENIKAPFFSDPNVIIEVVKNEYINKLIISNQLKIKHLKRIYNIVLDAVSTNFLSKIDNDAFQKLLKDGKPEIIARCLQDFVDFHNVYSNQYRPLVAEIYEDIDSSYQIIKEALKIIIEFDDAVKINNKLKLKRWLRKFTTLISLDYKYNVLNEDIDVELEAVQEAYQTDWNYSLIVLNNSNSDALYAPEIWEMVELNENNKNIVDYTDFNIIMNGQFDQIQSCFFYIQKSFIVLDEDKIYFNNMFSEFLRIFMNIQTITNAKEISKKHLSDFKIGIANLHKNDNINTNLDSCLSTIIEIVCGNKEKNDFSSTLKETIDYYNFFKNCILLPKMFHLSNKLSMKDPEKVTSMLLETLVKLGYSALASNQCYQLFFLKKRNPDLENYGGISRFMADVLFSSSCPCCKYLNIVCDKSTDIFKGSYVVRNVASDLSHIDNKSLVEIKLSSNTKDLIGTIPIGYNNLMDITQYKRFNKNMSQLLGNKKFNFHIVLDMNIASKAVLDVPIDYLKNKNDSFKRLWSSLNSKNKEGSQSETSIRLPINQEDQNTTKTEQSLTLLSLNSEIKNEIQKLASENNTLLSNNEFSLNSNKIVLLLQNVFNEMIILSDNNSDNEYSKAFLA